MNTSIPWEWYRTFLAVLQEGSLSGASRTLNITQPTAGRHIAGLEAALGQALFTRSQTGLLATDAALALRVHAEAMDNTARALERTAANFSRDRADLRGVVRVAASEVVGAEVLPPLVARLRQACPNIVIELMLSIDFRICFTGRLISRCGWSPRSRSSLSPAVSAGSSLGYMPPPPT